MIDASLAPILCGAPSGALVAVWQRGADGSLRLVRTGPAVLAELAGAGEGQVIAVFDHHHRVLWNMVDALPRGDGDAQGGDVVPYRDCRCSTAPLPPHACAEL